MTVRMMELATQDVSVLGQVRTPGTYSITTPQTILKVLSLAGGLTDAADRNVTVKRSRSGEQIKYYVSNNAEQALSDVVMVYPGDTVLVARAPMVYVMGDVSRPGGYTIATNDARLSVLQVIAMAGSASKTVDASPSSTDPDNRSWRGRNARSPGCDGKGQAADIAHAPGK